MTPSERANACFLATAGRRPLIWSSGGVSFRAENIDLTSDSNGIVATLTAWTGQGANSAYLPVDNPYIIINPPVYVPDGGFEVIDGEEHATVTQDPLSAYKMALESVVIDRARQLGWTG